MLRDDSGNCRSHLARADDSEGSCDGPALKLMVWDYVSQERADVLAKAIDDLEKRIDKIAAAIQTLIKPLRNSLVLKSILRSNVLTLDTDTYSRRSHAVSENNIDPVSTNLMRTMQPNSLACSRVLCGVFRVLRSPYKGRRPQNFSVLLLDLKPWKAIGSKKQFPGRCNSLRPSRDARYDQLSPKTAGGFSPGIIERDCLKGIATPVNLAVF